MKVDLNKSLSIHVGGQVSKNHALPIDYFVNVSKNLQELIISIAKHELSDEVAIDLSNFKIELCGFLPGSAVPQYRFEKTVNHVVGSDVMAQRTKVSQGFENVIKMNDSGNYAELKKMYKSPEVRNEIVEKLYKYANSYHGSPVEIVDVKKNGKVIKIYKNQTIKPETKKRLQTEIVETEKVEVLKENAVGKIAITRNKKGKISQKINDVYRGEQAALSYRFNHIIANDTKYSFYSYNMASIDREEDYFVITSDLFGITGTGQTEDEAKESFAKEFDYIFKRYNELGDPQLSDRLVLIKKVINAIVSKTEKI